VRPRGRRRQPDRAPRPLTLRRRRTSAPREDGAWTCRARATCLGGSGGSAGCGGVNAGGTVVDEVALSLRSAARPADRAGRGTTPDARPLAAGRPRPRPRGSRVSPCRRRAHRPVRGGGPGLPDAVDGFVRAGRAAGAGRPARDGGPQGLPHDDDGALRLRAVAVGPAAGRGRRPVGRALGRGDGVAPGGGGAARAGRRLLGHGGAGRRPRAGRHPRPDDAPGGPGGGARARGVARPPDRRAVPGVVRGRAARPVRPGPGRRRRGGAGVRGPGPAQGGQRLPGPLDG
jgi:hypothetical protein